MEATSDNHGNQHTFAKSQLTALRMCGDLIPGIKKICSRGYFKWAGTRNYEFLLLWPNDQYTGQIVHTKCPMHSLHTGTIVCMYISYTVCVFTLHCTYTWAI